MYDNKIIINKEDPFLNCKLRRRPHAEALTAIVSAYAKGFVLAVNGKWGSGKTTFMQMWRQSLENDSFKTIYFNAWENDFTSEPTIAIMGELKSLTTSETDTTFQSIIDKTLGIGSSALPALAKTAATLIGAGAIAEVVEATTRATVDALNKEIEEYDDKKKSFEAVREELSKFVKDKCDGRPLIFIVDELDRCRPNYAVEVLEKIKHFFAVEGIIFVLSIDKQQFCCAIKGYYGSNEIDAKEYLRRFYDLEYTLPQPSYNQFCRHLISQFDFGASNIISCYEEIAKFCDEYNFSLRQIEKFFIHTRIIAKVLDNLRRDMVLVFFYLIAIKDQKSDLYNWLKLVNTDPLIISNHLEEALFPYKYSENNDKGLALSYFLIFNAYLQAYNCKYGENISMCKIVNGIRTFAFETVHITNADNLFSHFSAHIEMVDVHISFYTDEIDLLSNLQ